MKPVHQGSIIITPPSLGPVITHTGVATVDVRLGHDDAKGRPLLVGAIPRDQSRVPHAARSALYTPWLELSFANSNSCVGLIHLDLPWHLDPDLCWLLFLVLAQPAGLQPRPGPAGQAHFTALNAVLARYPWMRGPHKDRPDPRPALQTDIESALNTWLLDDPETRAVFAPISQPDDLHLLAMEDPEDDPPPTHTRFVLGSCQYPPGILDHTPAQGHWRPSPPDKAMAALNQLRQSAATRPDFLLLVGDQVYLDATAGLFDPALTVDRFGTPYTHWLSQPQAQQALSGLPVHTMLDDHEITDNWAPVSPQAQGMWPDRSGTDSVFLYQNGLQIRGVNSYRTFQGPVQAQPHAADDPDDTDAQDVRDALKARPLWRAVGPSNRPGLVFLADTRTERSLRNARNIDTAEIMGEDQFAAITDWLAQPVTGPRFLACPAMVLPRRRWAVGATPASALYADAWDGYPHSLHRLLAALHQHQCDNVILLSGDEHLASVSVVDLASTGPYKPTRVHVIHTAGLYAPFPFANARQTDFLQRDAFCFDSPLAPHTQIHCTVRSWFAPPAHGFACIDAPARLATNSRVGVTFTLGAAQSTACDPMPHWLETSSTLQVRLRANPF